MITPLFNDNGQLYAFEVDNTYISLATVVNLLSSVNGVEIISKRRMFSGDDIHIKFLLSGNRMIVWEPYGDNSHYWIGPENDEHFDISRLLAAFESYSIPKYRAILGDILSLNLSSLRRRIFN